ncbi:hypothetical protein HDF18_13125 [Mucilaginibacter sp. X5P1]|uniref:hypothetical protein n=1 Tax=Mucilaginibacter sp. X5P1 TaxID=2723088 RepID=UPI0016161DF8|nr:hypothetical protein [Mucilaginibacter sp. X5P1]MBB6141717.1 hypothetical protein [Mucilaginibacter sp. X5P1]
MGQDLRAYKGAVLFVDILGFSALTNGQIELKKEDFEPWLKGSGHPHNNQFLAATILVEFRRILQQLELQFPKVKVAQLSDCFFAWSDKITDVVSFGHSYMHLAISCGLLSRGGMAQGEIIETNQNHSLGRLILGNAVTTAAGLEKLAKGARILIDRDLPLTLYKQNKAFSNRVSEMFKPFENLLDYQVYDEFKWYLTDKLEGLPDTGISHCTPEERLKFTKHRLKLDNKLLFSTFYSWNARNSPGMVQLKATSNFLSVSGLNGVKHDFDRRGFSGSRSAALLDAADLRIEHDPGYLIRG